MTNVEKFRKLNNNKDILHIGNVWDVNSALLFQKQNYKALGTSSFAIAKSLGYEDGEELTFDELYSRVKDILSKVNIPLSVDIEGGYSRNINEIANNIIRLFNIGVVGINIEDSIVKNKSREIIEKEKFLTILKSIKNILQEKNIDIFINVRIDCFIMGLENPLEETIKRIKLYEKSSIDGIFIPCITKTEDIKKIVDLTSLPINIMAMPNLDSFDVLKDVGVRRISQGAALYNSLISDFENKLKKIDKTKTFEGIFK